MRRAASREAASPRSGATAQAICHKQGLQVGLGTVSQVVALVPMPPHRNVGEVRLVDLRHDFPGHHPAWAVSAVEVFVTEPTAVPRWLLQQCAPLEDGQQHIRLHQGLVLTWPEAPASAHIYFWPHKALTSISAAWCAPLTDAIA